MSQGLLLQTDGGFADGYGRGECLRWHHRHHEFIDQGSLIMARHHPMTWTAVHLALASAATWLLLETEALSGALLVAFH
jgi:hypothetical protein